MQNKKDDSYFLSKIKADIQFIVIHMDRVEKQELYDNELLLDSMMFRMIQISENARKLSESFRSANRGIPWEAMTGLRNRIVHDYGNVDLEIVYETLKYDIPELLGLLM